MRFVINRMIVQASRVVVAVFLIIGMAVSVAGADTTTQQVAQSASNID